MQENRMNFFTRHLFSNFGFPILAIGTVALALAAPSSASATAIAPTEHQRLERSREQLQLWLEETSPDRDQSRLTMDLGKNEHLTFNSRAEAIAWAQPSVPFFQKIYGDANLRLLNNDPRYTALDKMVEEIWGAFTALFPAQTKNLNTPPVVLIDTKSSNAFVHQASDGKQVAHAIFIFTGLVNQATKNGQLDKNKLSGVIAHELAHSVFKHALTKYSSRMNRFYYRDKVAFGYQTPVIGSGSSPDPATLNLNQKMKNWVHWAHMSGDMTSDELQSLPSPSLSTGVFFNAFKQFQTDKISGQCSTGAQAFLDWAGFMRFDDIQGLYTIKDTHNSNSAEPGPFFRSSVALKAADRQCLAKSGKTPSLIDLISRAMGFSSVSLRNSSEFAGLEKDFLAAEDAVQGFTSVTETYRQQMRWTQGEIDFNKINFYSYEEHADEVSALAHAYLQRDPNAIGWFLMNLLKAKSPNTAAKCKALLASDKEPPTGSFSDPHRSSCYRVYHLQKFAASFGSDLKGFAQQFIQKSMGPLLADETLDIQ
jgi:Peptidase family M48